MLRTGVSVVGGAVVDGLVTGEEAGRLTGPPDHVLRNRVAWDRRAADYAGPGLRNWAAAEPGWGVWKVPEAQLGILPPDLAGIDSLELGCGTAYISAWLARRGARPVGLGGQRLGRVPHRPWRHDPAAAPVRVRHLRPH